MKPEIDISLSRIKRHQERVLLVACYEPRSVPSIVENIALIQQLSGFPVSVLNLAEHRVDTGYLKIPPAIDLDDYQSVVIHNTVSYNPHNLKSLDTLLPTKLADYRGVKIVFKQDEHHRFSEFTQFVLAAGIDAIFSIMPDSEIPKTYGVFLPGVEVHPMLTAYITSTQRNRFNPSGSRPIDIGYRGSIMPLSFGRLCYQKRKIGDEVSARLANSGLVLDISSRWEDRIGGDAWLGFLSRCKTVLGVESGSGLFDLDGTLSESCKKIEQDLGPDDGSNAYAEAYLKALSPYDGRIGYFMISPRHFEACAVGALQILFPGRYSGRLSAGRHYFELAEDYSNLNEAVDLLRDDRRRLEMADCAFEEVILDKANWIETFVEQLDSALLSTMSRKNVLRKATVTSKSPGRNLVVIQAHGYGCDPRRDDWYSAGATGDIKVHQIGINDVAPIMEILHGPRNEVIIKLPRREWTPDCLDKFIAQAGADKGASIALRELHFIAHCLQLENKDLLTIYGMPQGQQQAESFRWYLRYVLSTAVTLVHAGARTEGAHALVAINFPALVPALILKGLLGVPVIYEALEYWPEADPDQGDFAILFWRQFESRLVGYADYRGTVSPPMAHLMRDIYGSDFYYIPNAPLANEQSPAPQSSLIRRAAKQGEVRFLFQGNFAPYRGLEQLIQAWAKVPRHAVLILRGPDNPFRVKLIEMSRGLGLFDKTVLFPPAVEIDALISAAQSDGDVGLIPYTATGANYANCSPNKLGQYMTAGLPILANATNYVANVIRMANCGLAIDFQREQDLIDAVARLCDDNLRQVWGDNARSYFTSSFNWQVVAVPFYAAVEEATGGRLAEKLGFYLAETAETAETAATVPSAPVAIRGWGWKVVRHVWQWLPAGVRSRLRPTAVYILSRF